MRTLILVGGLGTRLRALVPDRPKAMAEFGGKPFLEYQIERLRAQGFDDIVLCVGHRADQIRDHFGDGSRWSVRIRYSVESEPLGTAGAIRNARDFIDGAFLVLNGDSYLGANLGDVVEFHRTARSEDPRAAGTLAAVAIAATGAYGALEMDDEGRIVAFHEKGRQGPGWINGGAYVLEPAILGLIPEGRAVSIERETFPLALERGHRLLGCRVEGFFVDIGTPEGHRRFERYMEQEMDS